MKYYLYKITNNINGKIYVGVHQTSNLNDGYFGSGIALKDAIKKYGKKNFTKEILQYFDNSEDMFKAESIVVNEEFIQNRNTYNIAIGGKGGAILPIKEPTTKNRIRIFHPYTKDNKIIEPERLNYFLELGWKEGYYRQEKLQPRVPVKDIDGNKFLVDINDPRYLSGELVHVRKGCKSTQEFIIKRTKTMKERYKDKTLHPSYGKFFIYNEELKETKKITEREFSFYESQGWKRGRKIKW